MEVSPYLHIMPWSHGGLEVNFCKFLTSALDGVVSILLWLLHPCRREPLCPLNTRLDRPHSWSENVEGKKSLLLSGIVLSAIQSIPSHLLFLMWEICGKFIFDISIMWKLQSHCLLRKQKYVRCRIIVGTVLEYLVFIAVQSLLYW